MFVQTKDRGCFSFWLFAGPCPFDDIRVDGPIPALFRTAPRPSERQIERTHRPDMAGALALARLAPGSHTHAHHRRYFRQSLRNRVSPRRSQKIVTVDRPGGDLLLHARILSASDRRAGSSGT